MLVDTDRTILRRVHMSSVNHTEVDETIALTFSELKSAIEKFNVKSIELYSAALRALVELRTQLDS